MIAFSFVFLIYIVVAGFGLWLAWQFVQAFISIARSLEVIGARYRSARTRCARSPPRPRLVLGLNGEFGRSTEIIEEEHEGPPPCALDGGGCLLRTVAALTGAQ
jgi:hypothetical protein